MTGRECAIEGNSDVADGGLFRADEYASLMPDLVLKTDGSRAILFSLETEPAVYYLRPEEGLAISLLNGQRRLSELRRIFARLFPACGPKRIDTIYRNVDDKVRAKPPSERYGGAFGAFEVSNNSIASPVAYDPRLFVVDPVRWHTQHADVRTRYRLEVPIVVSTVFTHRCATDCLYCYAERRRVREMPLSCWERILDEMVELEILLVVPDNGDILTRPDGLRFLEMLLERSFYFLLSTKASVSDATVRRLIQAGLDRPAGGRKLRPVQLSIDAADDDLLLRLRGVRRLPGQNPRETLLTFIRHGVVPRINTVVTGLNTHQILPLVDMYYPLGAREFLFTKYVESPFRHRDELRVPNSTMDDIQRQLETARYRYPDALIKDTMTVNTEEDGGLLRQPRQTTWKRLKGCRGGWNSLGIAADGSAFLCGFLPLDPEYLVGNAQVQSVSQIWNGERMRRLIFPDKSTFVGSVCADCVDFEQCRWTRGRCYRDALCAYGSIYQPPPQCPKAPRDVSCLATADGSGAA